MNRKAISFEDLQAGIPIEELSPWQKYELEFQNLTNFAALQKMKSLRLKKMFGGLAIYRASSLCAVLMRDKTQAEWNGILVCTSHEHHEELKKIIKSLRQHLVLKKWLHVRAKDKNMKAVCKKLCGLILKKSPLIGVRSKSVRS